MKPLPLWLKIAVGFALASGLMLRFCNLNEKVFWLDEVSTAWTVSGYSEGDVAAHLSGGGRVFHPADIVLYQQQPKDRNWLSTIRVLATTDAAHPPLFYLLSRAWRELAGSSVSAMRFVSATISVAVPVCAYFLGLELFGSALAGWIAAALIAVSPFHLYYAQEAREYALFAVLTLASSVLLLRALRVGTPAAQGLYAVSVAAGLYSSMLFFAVVAVHALYIFMDPARDLGAVRRTAPSLIIGSILSAPWVWTLAEHRHKVAADLAWLSAPVSITNYLAQCFVHVGWLFAWAPGQLGLGAPLAVGFVALVVFSMLVTFRYAPAKARTFVALLLLVPTLPLFAADIILHGSRLLRGRYLEAGFIAIELGVAFMFAHQLGSAPGTTAKRWWQWSFVALVIVGALSCLSEARSPAALDDNRNAYVTKLAPMINRFATPLVVSDLFGRNLLDISVLSRSLKPNVALAILNDPKARVYQHHRAIFALNPSAQLQRGLRTRFSLRRLPMNFQVFELGPLLEKDGASFRRE